MSKQLISEAARALNAMRKVHAGGTPLKLAPCRYCSEQMGARALRAHQPHCPAKPARKS